MGPMTSTRGAVRGLRRLVAFAACAPALAWMAHTVPAHAAEGVQSAGTVGAQPPGFAAMQPPGSALLVQCQTAGESSERSASFAGEMTMLAGTSRMAMRIELLERTPGETGYRPVLAPGVGDWHYAGPGVRTYRHIEQFTNLSAPANYRALITFRWEGQHGRVFKRYEQRSPRCQQPAPAPPVPSAPLE